jgi:hypothetical protein
MRRSRNAIKPASVQIAYRSCEEFSKLDESIYLNIGTGQIVFGLDEFFNVDIVGCAHSACMDSEDATFGFDVG